VERGLRRKANRPPPTKPSKDSVALIGGPLWIRKTGSAVFAYGGERIFQTTKRKEKT